jgi:Fe-S-cluster-containing hydrogenase component 2
MKSTTETITCDGCGKQLELHADRTGYTRGADDPWVTIRVSGNWVTDFNRQVKTDLDACSPPCVIACFERAIERMKKVPAIPPFNVFGKP